MSEGKMDKVVFAKLISYITDVADRELQLDEISSIDTLLAHKGGIRADPVAVNALLLRMWRREKIDAIREYRALTGSTLKDSKDAVEAYWLAEISEVHGDAGLVLKDGEAA